MRGLLSAWSGQVHPWGLQGGLPGAALRYRWAACPLHSQARDPGTGRASTCPEATQLPSCVLCLVACGSWGLGQGLLDCPPKTHTHTHTCPSLSPQAGLGRLAQGRGGRRVEYPRFPGPGTGIRARRGVSNRSRRPRERSPGALLWPPHAEARSLVSPGSRPSGGGKRPGTSPCGGDKISRLQAFLFPYKKEAYWW